MQDTLRNVWSSPKVSIPPCSVESLTGTKLKTVIANEAITSFDFLHDEFDVAIAEGRTKQ